MISNDRQVVKHAEEGTRGDEDRHCQSDIREIVTRNEVKKWREEMRAGQEWVPIRPKGEDAWQIIDAGQVNRSSGATTMGCEDSRKSNSRGGYLSMESETALKAIGKADEKFWQSR